MQLKYSTDRDLLFSNKILKIMPCQLKREHLRIKKTEHKKSGHITTGPFEKITISVCIQTGTAGHHILAVVSTNSLPIEKPTF